MKHTRNVAIILLITIVCVGCNNNSYDDIDNIIPEIESTDDSSHIDKIDTSDDHIHVCDDDHEQEHNHYLEDGYHYETYDDTYKGDLQRIYDILYRMTEDINLLKETDQYKKEYDTFLSLMTDVIDGHTQKNKIPQATVNVKGMFSYYNYDHKIVDLFVKYPNEAADEAALIEFTRYFCYLYAVLLQGSTEGIYKDDTLYYALFPNTNNIISNTAGGKTFVSYEGYTGDIVVLERADRINKLSIKDTVFSDTAEIVNYTGTVSVAPVNQYGAVGRTSHLYVSSSPDDDIITSIYINGNMIMINPDVTSQEYINMRNQKEIRSAKENYLDSIDNVPYLSVLQVSHCELSDTSQLFSKIPMENINTLDLSNNDLEELDLSSFSSLDSLDLNGNIDLRSLKMPNRKSVLYLGLRNTSIDSLDFLSEYETIANIDIRETAVSDLTSLADKNVYNLDFNADITDYSGLCNIKNLKSLNIVSNEKLSDELRDLVKSIGTVSEFYYNYKVVPLS